MYYCMYYKIHLNYITYNKKTALLCGLYGGDKRDRTADLLNAIQALSQLSYTPMHYSYILLNTYGLCQYNLTFKHIIYHITNND